MWRGSERNTQPLRKLYLFNYTFLDHFLEIYENYADMTILFITSIDALNGYEELETLFDTIRLRTAETMMLKDVKI